MDRDAIERLAMDSACGELNEDAEALLSEYLAGNAEADRWAADVREVCEKTEAAIQKKTKNSGSGLEGAPVAPKPALPVRLWPVTRLAAAVVIAAFIGFAIGHRQESNTTYGPPLPDSASIPKQVRTVADLREQYAGTFWGDKMLAVIEHRPDRRHQAARRAGSLWDRYGKYIKENRHE